MRCDVELIVGVPDETGTEVLICRVAQVVHSNGGTNGHILFVIRDVVTDDDSVWLGGLAPLHPGYQYRQCRVESV